MSALQRKGGSLETLAHHVRRFYIERGETQRRPPQEWAMFFANQITPRFERVTSTDAEAMNRILAYPLTARNFFLRHAIGQLLRWCHHQFRRVRALDLVFVEGADY